MSAIVEPTHEALTPVPTNPMPTNPVPTPTPKLETLTATVWQEIPQVPILMYHRFYPQPGAPSSKYRIPLSEFEAHLNSLYNAGFSLISLEDWLSGRIHIPEGRRPLIITMDDLYYADQISLDANGQPAPYSAVGVLWQFYQQHPDFNFHLALFYNLGDKQYANVYQNGVYTVQEGWRQDRAEAIAWGIKNGAIPMNHFYDHPFLDRLTPDEILWQLQENDQSLRDELLLIGQEDLSKNLPNILALPYVVWPKTDAGKQVLFDYISPDGAPVAAILEANDASLARLFPAPFSPTYDRWHVHRINATWQAIEVIMQKAGEIPVSARCELGDFPEGTSVNAEATAKAISAITVSDHCPYGFYIVGQFSFFVQENGIIQFSP